jgi:hypothetical protein
VSAEKTYTLAEARQENARQECAAWGHDLDFIHQAWSREPKAAMCSRGCGHPGWAMIPADQPHLWRSVAPAIAEALRPFPSAADAVNAAVAAVLEPGQVLR